MTIFGQPKYKKYADIIKVDTISNARESVMSLKKEYKEAQTNIKKLRIIKVLIYTINRIEVTLKRTTLSISEQYEFKRVLTIYKDLLDKISKDYKR